jgi:hypothetical protein
MAGNKRKSVNDARKPLGKRLNVQLREDALTRLMIHCVCLGKNPGDLLSDLVDANLRQFRVQANTRGSVMPNDSASEEVRGEDSLAEAA